MKKILLTTLVLLCLSITNAQMIRKAGPGFQGNPVCAAADNKGNIYFVSCKLIADSAQVYKYELSTKKLSKVVTLFPIDSTSNNPNTVIRLLGVHTRILCIEDSVYIGFSQNGDQYTKGYTDIVYRIVNNKPRIVGKFASGYSFGFQTLSINGFLNYKGKLLVYHTNTDITGIKNTVSSKGLTTLSGNTWTALPGVQDFTGIQSAVVLNDSLLFSVTKPLGQYGTDSIFSYNNGNIRGLKILSPYLALAGNKVVCSHSRYDYSTYTLYGNIRAFNTGNYSTMALKQESKEFRLPSYTARSNGIYTYVGDSGLYYTASNYLLRYNTSTAVFDEVYKFTKQDSSHNFTLPTDSGIFLFSSGDIIYNGTNCSQFAQMKEKFLVVKVFAGIENITQKSTATFTVFPNPSSGELKVVSTQNSEQFVSIFDVMGRLKASYKLGGNELLAIDTEAWTPGVYTVKSQNGLATTIFIQ